MARVPFPLMSLLQLAMLGCTGCMLGIGVPAGKTAVAGPNFSPEAVAFLDLPGATREEAIASLGPPSLEATDSRVLAYVCQWGTKWHMATAVYEPFSNELTHPHAGEEVDPHGQMWVLLIAYNRDGIVCGHTIHKLGHDGVAEECSKWKRSLLAETLCSKEQSKNGLSR